MKFSRSILSIDAAAETDRIVAGLRHSVHHLLRRRGAVVGVSGGVDSAVVLALSVQAFGADAVCAVFMPEQDSETDSGFLAGLVASQYGVPLVRENITRALEGLSCYQRRDEAIRRVFPEFRAEAGYKARITLPANLLEEGTLNVCLLTVVRPDQVEESRPLPLDAFLQITAATNFKQRTRMSMLYYHAELRRYAVIGTANKDEHDQGFFVKYGDAAVDVKAIAHLYKTQVYQLAEHLGVPEVIRSRTPTSDTYSAPTSQEAFFFRLPFDILDLLWYAREHDIPLEQVAAATGLSPAQIQHAFRDFEHKARSTEYLRTGPLGLAGAPSMPAGTAAASASPGPDTAAGVSRLTSAPRD